MDNAIRQHDNRINIDLAELKDVKIKDMITRLKEIVYHNKIDVFYILADEFDDETKEYYFFCEYIKEIKSKFNIFLMLETRYFKSTKFYDSIFALGVDALTLSIADEDLGDKSFKDTMKYVTKLWPSGAVFIDVIAVDCSNDEIKKKITLLSGMKVIPRIMMETSCGTDGDTFCVRDFILTRLKKSGVSLKWVMNFSLCSVIQPTAGGKGRIRRQLAGKVALELASLRRKLMVKEVQSSFDSASL